MKNLFFESTTTLSFDAPVVDHHFLLRSLPPTYAGQRIMSATLQILPSVPYTLSCDGFGNLNETGCIKFPHTEFVYSVSGLAQIDQEDRQKERLHPIFKHPSFYTGTNDSMKDFLLSLDLQGTNLEKSIKLSDAIFTHMTYQTGVTATSTTAIEAFALAKGVCQDYTHVFIALARLAAIPCRYANGLLLGEGQSHAWVEIYCDGMWIAIDPTHNNLVGEDSIRFCTGRDFLDCALERGVLYGVANQSQMNVTIVKEQ
ncbi:MAG: transglutaminase family protein [Lachnospiraceae bacterium]